MDSAEAAALIEKLGSAPVRQRVEAELRLVEARQVGPLIGALCDRRVEVRVHAAHALGRLGDPAAAPALRALLADSENHGAAAIAAEKALVALGAGAVEALLWAATHGPGRARALRALSGVPEAAARADELRPLLRDQEAPVRRQAGLAFLALRGRAAVAALTPLLSDPDKWVRYELAVGLGELGCLRGRACLLEAVADEEERGTAFAQRVDELLEELTDLERTGQGWS